MFYSIIIFTVKYNVLFGLFKFGLGLGLGLDLRVQTSADESGAYASAAYGVMLCPSVRLSRSCILSNRMNISSIFFTFG